MIKNIIGNIKIFIEFFRYRPEEVLEYPPYHTTGPSFKEGRKGSSQYYVLFV